MINRLPKCKECKDRFMPYNNNSLQKFCMNKDKCIEAHLKFCKDKKEAAETKAVNKRSKNKRKDHPEIYYKENKKQLQDLLQKIARLIDKGTFCIDCDRTEAHRYDGGHYISKGSNKSISLNLHNIFQQNGWCNNQGNTSNEQFMRGIIKMYGEEYGEIVEGLALKYSYVGLKAHEYPELITEALKIARELKKLDLTYTPKQRIKLREKYNKRLNIYK